MTTQLFLAERRGRSNFGWLDSKHSFSFGQYYNPEQMGFGPLRVINDDRVTGGAGFGAHPHRDMEIISYVVEGGLKHKDSMGTGSVIQSGDVQIMSAGTGVTHSEFNASEQDPVRFLQIWITPESHGLAPRYEQKHFPLSERQGSFKLLVSPQGTNGSLSIRRDVSIWGGVFAADEQATYELQPERKAWVQVVRGQVDVLGHSMREGDGLAIEDTSSLTFKGVEDAEVLLFDLPQTT